MTALLLAAAMACAPGAIHAQDAARDPLPAEPAAISRPLAASRFVQFFDFEERLTNPNPVPRFWARVYDAPQGEGTRLKTPVHPRWNQGELVFRDAGHPSFSGEASVCLPTEGGSTRLVLEPGVVPVFAGADYRVNAMVRTKGLKAARARVLVRFLERDGTPIAASEQKSDLILSPESWTPVGLELVGEHLRAAFLQVQLDLLQPAQFDGAADPARVMVGEDFEGAAYFDDVEIIQLPRAEITTNSPLNIEVWPKTPELVARIRDMTGERLSVTIETFDAEGRLIDSLSRAIAGAERVSHAPKVEKLGWYRSVMTITAKGSPIGVDAVDFGVVPPLVSVPGEQAGRGSRPLRVSSADRGHFGVIAGPLPERVLESVHELPRRLGTGTLTLDATGLSTAPDSPLARAVALCLEEWQEMTLTITRLDIPGPAADRPLHALGATREALASLEPLLDRFGQRVRRYQFGRTGDEAWYWEPEANPPAPVARALQRYVSGPIVTMPLRVDRSPWLLPSDVLDVSFLVPYGLSPKAVGEAVGTLKPSLPAPGERQGITLALQCAPEGLYSPRAAAADMVRRAIEAWVASPVSVPNVALLEPWTIAGARRPQLLPRAELIAWRSTIDRLLDRRVIAKFPSPEGTSAYLLAPLPGAPVGSAGALVAWNDSAPPAQAALDAYLGGSGIRLVDIFGNERAPELISNPDGRADARRTGSGIHVPLTSEPVFIEGVDTELARFLCDFRIEPATIEPGTPSSDHQLILRNPFESGISGTITLISPSRSSSRGATHEWKITPRVARFTAGPGEEARLPLSITAGSGLELGPQPFVFQVDLAAGGEYPPLTIRRDVNLGLENVRVNLSYRIVGENDLILEAALTNISQAPLNLSLTAFAPEQARQPATVSGLLPSNQSIRRFNYPGLAAQLRGKRLTINLMDADSGVRVSSSIAIE